MGAIHIVELQTACETMTLAIVKNAQVILPDGRILRFPDCTVKPGCHIAIKGPSGAGKTTLLRLLAGLATPTKGLVTLTGNRIGYAFQEPRLVPHISAVENIRFANAMASDAQIFTWLEKVGLQSVPYQRADQLSGGEAQRVNVLRALIAAPQLLLLDEPDTGLDDTAGQQLRSIIVAQATEHNMAVVEVSHRPHSTNQTHHIINLDVPTI